MLMMMTPFLPIPISHTKKAKVLLKDYEDDDDRTMPFYSAYIQTFPSPIPIADTKKDNVFCS
jgi:hypothetical protein